MDNKLKREQIGNGVYFSTVTDKRYKLNRITVIFMTQLSAENASVNALIPRILSRQNKYYPDNKDFHNYEASLYSAKVGFDADSMGDTQRLELSITSIDDAFALNGEKITRDAAKLIMDCIFEPALVDGVFGENDVAVCKREQCEDIEAELNEKRIYALNRAYEIMCEGEPAAVPKLGTVEKTSEITSKSLYEAYLNMLDTFMVEIVCVGCNDFSDVKALAKDIFGRKKRGNIAKCQSRYSYAKAAVAEKTEKLQVSQSKMVLGLKTDSTDYHALALMSKLYGGTTTSKLFMNVREKLSLCYYCWARFNREKGLMHIDCGIENENIEKAKAEILKQFEDVKSGSFTDEDIETARLSVQNDTKTVNDSLGGLTEWYLTRIYRNDIKTPEESLLEYDRITRDDIKKAANSMKLDTVYVLTSLNDSEVN